MEKLKSHKTFNGKTEFWSHDSHVTKTKMKFSTFIPEGEIQGAIIWLSGLTCTDENFITKAGAQRVLSKNKLMVICPDTSPRGLDLPDEHTSYDFGSGAGFYLNATTDGYKDHYKMYDYINDELYKIIQNEFKVQNIAISGHSMGGHGALVIGLKNPTKYKSISAFSPITHPTTIPWGEKAFKGYLGEDKSTWIAWDSCELLKAGKTHAAEILVHQGLSDEFLENQLKPRDLENTAKEVGQKLKLNLVEGFDHSYYFIQSFIEEHIDHHSKYLKG